MSIKASAVRFNIDAENILRAEGQGAITATGASGSKELGLLSAYWNAGDLAMPEQVAIVLFVTSLATAGADEVYTLDVEVATDDTFADATTVVSTVVTKTGQAVVLVPRDAVIAALDNASHIRVNFTLAGIAPSINYWGILSPIQGR